jgi:hypothetical protein
MPTQEELIEKNIERALAMSDYKWSVEDFTRCETYVAVEYDHISKCRPEHTKQLLNTILEWMRTCDMRPHDIFDSSLRFYDYF